MTKNGSGSLYVSCPAETSRSCIAWRRAACVFGEDLFGHVRLADHDLAELVEQLGPGLGELAEVLGNAVGGHRRSFRVSYFRFFFCLRSAGALRICRAAWASACFCISSTLARSR